MALDIVEKFSTHLKNVLTRALVFVVENDGALVEPEHLLWALGMEKGSIASEIIEKSDLSTESLNVLVGDPGPNRKATPASSPFLSDRAKRAVEKAVLAANTHEHRYVGTEHLLSGLLQMADPRIDAFLSNQRVNVTRMREDLAAVLASASKLPELTEMLSAHSAEATGVEPTTKNGTGTDTGELKTPALDFFGRDLTSKAIQEKIDPVIGREEEIERVMEILARRTKNNPMLLGEPGVGKTAIVEGLAKRIMEGRVPPTLADKRVIAIDLGLVVAGTVYRGEFEARIKQIVEEVKKCGNVVLFVDEVHQMVGAGASGGSMDAANMLKPALARGEIRCIGATTPAEFKKHIETDPALERRFQTVMVKEPTPARAAEILRGVASQYETYHNVRISPAAIDAAVKLSVRYLTDKRLPDKALDLVDEASAASRVRRKESGPAEKRRSLSRRVMEIQTEKRLAVAEERFERAAELKQEEAHAREAITLLPESSLEDSPEVITDREIARVISKTLGIPLEDLLADGARDLDHIRAKLAERVIGQDDAVASVAAALRRAKTGLSMPNRPLASMLFLGPTGVGKTELARAIADAFFSDPTALVRLDMSEYAEGFTSSKLLGAPAGYVGYREGSTLSDRVKDKPYCVVLFDELEKAHKDVQNLLLQILEEGELTDATGRKVSFRNAIVVLTSNVGLERFESGGIGFMSGEQERVTAMSSDIRKELETRFRPELLNRVDLTSLFRPLGRDVLAIIADKQLKELAERLAERGVRIATDAAAAHTIADGVEVKFGARDIRRHIQTKIEDKIADLVAADPSASLQIHVTKDGLDVKYARRRSTT